MNKFESIEKTEYFFKIPFCSGSSRDLRKDLFTGSKIHRELYSLAKFDAEQLRIFIISTSHSYLVTKKCILRYLELGCSAYIHMHNLNNSVLNEKTERHILIYIQVMFKIYK